VQKLLATTHRRRLTGPQFRRAQAGLSSETDCPSGLLTASIDLRYYSGCLSLSNVVIDRRSPHQHAGIICGSVDAHVQKIVLVGLSNFSQLPRLGIQTGVKGLATVLFFFFSCSSLNRRRAAHILVNITRSAP